MADWEFYVDRGGTFTDVIAQSPQGEFHVEKLLSENPKHYQDAAIEGITRVLSTHNGNFADINSVKMGTTVATNALLQHKGHACALLITQGFKDLLNIAYQNRPDLFALEIKKPTPLYQQVIEIKERITHDGSILTDLDLVESRQQLLQLQAQGIDSVAIVLMHSLKNPAHELALATLAQELGFKHIYCSHQTTATPKIVRRGQTTVIDAYLSPIVSHYITQVLSPLHHTKLYFMQSSGGLTTSENVSGKNTILSGPAGGVIGAVKTASLLGFDKVIGFDMGGTSTDVCHYDGAYERQYESNIHGLLLDVPMMNIHTVAAGGGSVLNYQEGRFQVGPDSAGAMPGPACYRNGGPLTITDANLLLGKIPLDSFPPIFADKQTLDLDLVKQLFSELSQEIDADLNPYQVAQGFVEVAVDNMCNAIKKISSDKGYELSKYILNCFGGAGAQHACLIAEKLGIKTVLIHRFASVLSALGMAVAPISLIEQQNIGEDFDGFKQDTVTGLKERLIDKFKASDVDAESLNFSIKYLINYHGSDYPIELTHHTQNLKELIAEFHQKHKEVYGFYDEQKPLSLQTLIVEATLEQPLAFNLKTSVQDTKITKQQIFTDNQWHQVEVIPITSCTPKKPMSGPLLLSADNTTIVVEPGWQAEVDERGNVLLKQQQQSHQQHASTKVSPILLEVFNNAFMNCAELMGSVLAKTAHSVNIKERRDYSCALFDAQGNLIANAPHMPVHLGSMSESVKQILSTQQLKQGDSYLLNNPYLGGTHLPDITVVTPVFCDNQLRFFVASRGHHADVGGIAPGSLPANSQSLLDEGIIIDDFLMCQNHQLNSDDLLQLFTQGGARNPEQNLADLKAQLAANQKGIAELKKLITNYGLDTVLAYVTHIQDNAKRSVEEALSRLQSGNYCYRMDGGMQICVDITIKNKQATFDFHGTSKQQANNFNAPVAVTKAAILYVLRTLVDKDIPLNEGCLKPIEIDMPTSSLINPSYPHAVVAGNVETSQAIVNCLYCALGVIAAAQGTMNNLTFGNDTHQYYETLCGGTGAGATFNGCDAIHSHMTNSLLTDPEVLESRFPILLHEFSIRKHSGGKGKHHGGNGITRCIEFRAPMTVNMISNHRETAPPGLNGGTAGQAGENLVVWGDGSQQKLPANFETKVTTGDKLIIKTPGGGGYS